MNTGKPPTEYIEMFRHYFPNINLPAINECWKRNATPTEYRLTLERIEQK
jgi:hypothetical protein